jgi:hypothetical protein
MGVIQLENAYLGIDSACLEAADFEAELDDFLDPPITLSFHVEHLLFEFGVRIDMHSLSIIRQV